MKRNWFFIILLLLSSLSLAGTAAYFSIFGLAKLFHGAGIGIIVLATVLEFSKLVTVSYVYRYWKYIAKALRAYYIFGVLFIMLLTSIGIYGFLTSAYQTTINKVEIIDSRIKIAENKRNLFVAQLDRINKTIESSNNRINSLSGVRDQQEKRLSSLYDNNRVSSAKRTENQINGSDEQIKLLNDDITKKMSESNSVNDSISYYDQKIVEYKSSDVSSEIGPLKYLSDLTGYEMNKIVNFLVLLIIFVFDPMAITLLIGVNQLMMIGGNENLKEKNKEKIFSLFKRKKKKLPVISENETIEEKEEDTIHNSEDLVENYEDEDIQEDNKIEDDDIEYPIDNKVDDDLKKKENFLKVCQEDHIEKIIDLNISDIHNGMIVYHETFGKGIVIKCENNNRVFINFESGVKELMSEYANLKEIICIEKKNEQTIDEVYEIKKEDLPPEIVNNLKDDYVMVNNKWVDPQTPWIVKDNFTKIKKR